MTHGLKNIADGEVSDYADTDKIREEVIKAKRLYARNGWPVIDVTSRSVEETAAKIIARLSERRSSGE